MFIVIYTWPKYSVYNADYTCMSYAQCHGIIIILYYGRRIIKGKGWSGEEGKEKGEV